MKTIILISIMLTFSASAFGQEAFKDFLEEQNQEFSQYTRELYREFDEYKKIIEEEYRIYKNEILAYWPEAEISGAKKWVEYSKNKKIKKIVDFEKGNITIEVIVYKNEKKDIERFENILTDLLLEDKLTAFERDTLARNIENKILKKLKHLKTGNPEKEPILGPLFIATAKPGISQTTKTSIELLKNSQIKSNPSKLKNSKVLSLNIKFPDGHILKRAKHYKPMIVEYSNERKINSALVLALIHTESSFNPMAKSYVPAYGLMQIVPGSAGMDATKLLFGKPVLLTPSYLYNDENNINIGTAYLGVLYYRYFKRIKNNQSRLYCSIAAYNTGPGNVARAFTGKRSIKGAVKIINTMSSKRVYETLIKKLPYDETKLYVKKVAKRINLYDSL